LPRVVLYAAAGCGLCVDARATLERLRAELGFALEVVPIDGDDALEAAYRVSLPVVEIDGERAFEFFVDPDELRERLSGRG
jgi:glutaredoxin